MWLCGPACDGESHGGHPVNKSGKIPLHREWSEAPRHGLTVILKQMREGSNLAVRTGHVAGSPVCLVVVDTDNPESEAWVSANLPPTPWMVQTARGWHRYYLLPVAEDGTPRRVVKKAWKIRLLDGTMGTCDVQGDGGYVVAPGSVHHSGQEYIPTRKWVEADIPKVPTFDEMWFPVEIAEREGREAPSGMEVRRRWSTMEIAEGLLRAREFLTAPDCPVSVSGHHGDDTAYSVALALIQGFPLADWFGRIADEVASGVSLHELKDDEREQVGLALLVENWNPRCLDSDNATPYPWPTEILRRKVREAIRSHLGGKPRWWLFDDPEVQRRWRADNGHLLAPLHTAPSEIAEQTQGASPGTVAFQGLSSQTPVPNPAQVHVQSQIIDLPPLQSDEDRLINILVSHDTEGMKFEAMRAIRAMDTVYVRDSHLVDIVHEDGFDRHGERRRPWVRNTTLAYLKSRLNSEVFWYTMAGRGEEAHKVRCRADGETVKAILAAGSYPDVPRLEAIVYSPVLRADGTILQRPGYDEATGLVYLPEMDFGTIKEHPEPIHCSNALACLLEIIADFPFVLGKEDQCRAVWLSAVLTRFCRFAYSGLAPMFCVSAAEAGSGKGKLVDTICVIGDGKPVECVTFTGDVSEDDRVILSKLVDGAHAVSLDNIPSGLELASSAYEMMLTAQSFSGREIGTSKNKRIKLGDTMWFATGNHLKIGGDMPRRTLLMEILDRSGKPTQRAVKRGDLVAHCKWDRARLVRAAMTLLSGYVAAGRPYRELPTFASFEPWSAIVRQCVVWAGLPDPCEAVGSSKGNQDNRLLGSIVEYWRDLFPQGEYMSRACGAIGLDPKRFGAFLGFLKDNGMEKITPVGMGRFLSSKGSRGVHTDRDGKKWRLVNRADGGGSHWSVVEA